jgi:hypothetical protein
MATPESRRQFYRVSPSFRFRVEMGGAVYEGVDLSVYGMAFLVPQSIGLPEARVGAPIDRLFFDIDDRRVVVDAKVQYVKFEGGEQAALKIGVEFTRIEPDDVWFLSSVIAKHEVRTDPAPVSPARKAKTKAKPKAKAKPKGKPKAKAKTKAKPKAKKPAAKAGKKKAGAGARGKAKRKAVRRKR